MAIFKKTLKSTNKVKSNNHVCNQSIIGLRFFELVHVVVVLFFFLWMPATANLGQQTAKATAENCSAGVGLQKTLLFKFWN